MTRIKTWAGDLLLPTTFGRCLRTHFLHRPRGRAQVRWRPHIRGYMDDGQEEQHTAQLASLGIARFAFLGGGGDSFVMRARGIDNRKLVVRVTDTIVPRPKHPLIMPALWVQHPATNKRYGYEILPRAKTKGITNSDVMSLAVDLASSGVWVEDLHDENIGRWRGRMVVFDVGNGVHNYWVRPKAFKRSLKYFITTQEKEFGRDPRMATLKAIVAGVVKPRPAQPAKPPRPLAVPPYAGGPKMRRITLGEKP